MYSATLIFRDLNSLGNIFRSTRRKTFLALKIDEIAAGYWLQIHLSSFCVLREFLLIYFSCFEIEYYFSCLPLYTKARM
jgi:uncharacterized membrane protein YcfT